MTLEETLKVMREYDVLYLKTAEYELRLAPVEERAPKASHLKVLPTVGDLEALGKPLEPELSDEQILFYSAPDVEAPEPAMKGEP